MLKRKINYIGWLGNSNLGDEALYSVTQELLSEYEFRPYDCYRNLTLSSAHMIRQNEDLHSYVSIFGGGTLLPDDITWIKPARHNYLFGVAVKNPSFPSKFYSSDKVIIERLKSFRFKMVGVRDNFSKDSMANWGIESEVIGDPILSLKPSPNLKRNQTRIGINVGCDGFLWGGDQNRVVNEMIHVCKILKEKGYNLILIPFSKQDFPYAVALSEKVGIQIFREWTNPKSVLDLIATFHVLIGERLHSLVMSAAAYTPFIALEYRPKCHAFSETVGLSQYCIRTDKIAVGKITEMVDNLLNNWTEMKNLLKRKVDYYRQQQIQFVERIKKDLNSLPENAWTIDIFKERMKNSIFWNSDVILRRNSGRVWRIYNRLVFLSLIHHVL